jgi:hypothetical protein
MDYGIPFSQTLSLPPTYPASPFMTPTLAPTSSFLPTPAPLQHSVPGRPKKQHNPKPRQISSQLSELDDKLVDAFDKFADLINDGIPLVKNETDQRFFYERLRELRTDFDSLIILHGGKKTRKNKNKKTKTKRTKN